MSMKPCAVKGCEEPCPSKNLMCRQHWMMVPEPLQRTIWRLWNKGRPKPGYREACDSAAEQVQALLATAGQGG